MSLPLLEPQEEIKIIHMKDKIIPMYDDVFEDIFEHNHTHYTFAGGRGSTKSSFVGGIVLPLLIINNPLISAVCFRKVANTIQNSIYAQVVWGIYELGLEELFHIPKTYANPIVYKPTGQKIFFMGLDDPDKVKSIKVSKGYIGVTWFEELDQYDGEAELRKVLQSSMRGGDLFWDFRTFNPPISIDNWANEYAESIEENSNTLLVRNTYLDVPEEWLGQQFIDEALTLKAKNERAYRHEYLGEATGTGGSVFENACDLNMEQLVDLGDRKVPMYKTFDNIYTGLDWGYGVDPFRVVRVHLDKTRHDIYIFDEYSSNGKRNEETFEDLYIRKKIVGFRDLVTADSAEPKSIADFKAYGAYIRGAEKGPESVRYGIKWLQGLNHIYIDKRRCPLTYKEFTRYEYEKNKAGEFISSFPDKENHSIDGTRYALEQFYKRKGN